MNRLILAVLAVTLTVASSAPLESTSPVAILRQIGDGPDPLGNYNYNYEAANGINVEEKGTLRQVAPEKVVNTVQGSYLYVNPEGKVVQVTYTADENGFHPEGAHLPVAPLIPEAIQRSLAWIQAHPQPQSEEDDNESR